MTSSTNERQIVARSKRAERERIDDELVMKNLMSTPRGRGWIWRRLSEAQLFVEDTGLDPYWLAYSKGKRNAGLRLLKDAQGFTPQEYVMMTEENANVILRPEISPQDEGDSYE